MQSNRWKPKADFGKIEIDTPEGRRTVLMLLFTWAYSTAVFAVALLSEKNAITLHATCEGFERFGCLPR